MVGSTHLRGSWPGPGAAALVLAALLAVTGCASQDESPPRSATATAGTSVTVGPTTGDSDAVTRAFVTFFSGGSTAAEKIAVLQHGTDFTATIEAQAGSPMAQGTTAQVTNVDLDAPGHASVTYTVLMDGQPALTDQLGEAVLVGDTWKVGQATFCALLTLEGNPPRACAGPTTAPGPTG